CFNSHRNGFFLCCTPTAWPLMGFGGRLHRASVALERRRPRARAPLAALNHLEQLVRRLALWRWIPASAPAARRPRQQPTLCALGAAPLLVAPPKLLSSGASCAAGPVLARVQIISIARAIVHVQPRQQSTERGHARIHQLVEQRVADRRPALIAAFVGAAKAGERERLRAAQRWISRGTHIKLLFKFDGVPPPSGFTENEARRLPGWSGLRRSGDIGGPRGHGLTRLVALERAHWKRGQPVRDLARQPHALAADDARARERAVPHPQPDRRVGHARDRDDLVLAEQPHDA